MEHFKHRSEQLLVFNITAGEGWTKHCPFLDEQVPAVSFPCANTVAEREKLLRRESFWPRRMYRNFRRRVKLLADEKFNSVLAIEAPIRCCT